MLFPQIWIAHHQLVRAGEGQNSAASLKTRQEKDLRVVERGRKGGEGTYKKQKRR
jgi:hypothetical protein